MRKILKLKTKHQISFNSGYRDFLHNIKRAIQEQLKYTFRM